MLGIAATDDPTWLYRLLRLDRDEARDAMRQGRVMFIPDIPVGFNTGA